MIILHLLAVQLLSSLSKGAAPIALPSLHSNKKAWADGHTAATGYLSSYI